MARINQTKYCGNCLTVGRIRGQDGIYAICPTCDGTATDLTLGRMAEDSEDGGDED